MAPLHLIRSPRRFAIAAVAALGAAIALLAAAPGVGPVNGPAGDAADGALARTAANRGPTCVPARLNASAVLPGSNVRVSPLPGSLDASPRTQVSLLGVPASRLSDIRVAGSRSGDHSGSLRGYSQGDGASFVPFKPFRPGELVTVAGAAAGRGFSYRFNVAVPDPIPTLPPGGKPAGHSGDVQSFRSRPDLRPPTITVSKRASSSAPGFLFAAPYAGPGQTGPMIFDSSGQLVWFQPLPSNFYSTNLQVQQYQGQPVLTYWQGYIPPQGFGEGAEIVDNSAYQIIAVVRAGNGYSADLHDFQITGPNTAYLTVFNPIHCDLSAVRGPADSALMDGVFQQIDLATGLVRQEWHSLDHVPQSQSHQATKGASLRWPLDSFHINSVVALPDGDVMVSSRSTWAAYEVSSATGQVLTSIGGSRSSVKMGPGTTTAWQHDARVLADGTISIFDNGAVPVVERQSRGILERLDPAGHTLKLMRQYFHPGVALSAASQGNFQTLPNGDAFLGWGSQPYFTEFSPSGSVVFDAHMPPGDQSYRGYRFPWTGTPAGGPSLGVSRSGRGLRACASWNGATQVASWRVLAGRSISALAPVATAPRSGFETCIAAASSGPYAQVQALGSSGQVLGSSSALHA